MACRAQNDAIDELQQYARHVGIACAGLRITSTDDLLSAGWKPPARVERDEDFELVPTPEMRPDDRPQPERSTPRRRVTPAHCLNELARHAVMQKQRVPDSLKTVNTSNLVVRVPVVSMEDSACSFVMWTWNCLPLVVLSEILGQILVVSLCSREFHDAGARNPGAQMGASQAPSGAPCAGGWPLMSSLIRLQTPWPAWQRPMPLSPARSAAAPRVPRRPRQPLHQVRCSMLDTKESGTQLQHADVGL